MPEKVIRTTCTMDCPDSCALDVTVSNGRISDIRGARKAHPDTAGFICTKVSRFHQRVYHPDRLLYPMRRRGAKGKGEFERISWDQAIAEITTRFQDIRQQWGGEAIWPYHYGGSNGLLADSLTDHLYFARLGASRCEKTLCAAPSGAVATGMYGKMPGVAFSDYVQAQFILIWGGNPKVSNIHLMPYLRRAKRRGAFIAVVDPRRQFSDNEIDLHLPVLPGGDLPLALGIIHHWMEKDALDKTFLATHGENLQILLSAAEQWPLERAAAACGIPAGQIRAVAERYAAASPAVLRSGWGLERNRNGGQALAAILAMPALLGKFGITGGGYTMSNSGAVSVDTAKILGDPGWHTRNINQTRMGEVLLEENNPPVKGLFIYNCNPVATVPDQNRVIAGLQREDLFTVVFEQVMTDTTPYADILLPAVTFLEQYEIKKAYGSYAVGGVQPVIDPPGEARPNEQVFAELARAMGFTDEVFQWDTQTLMDRVAASLALNGAGADREGLKNGQIQQVRFEGGNPVQFGSVFPRTATGKINFAPAQLGPEPYAFRPVSDTRFPLALISPGNEKMISSSFGEFNYPELFLSINPQDAAERSIKQGDRVRIFNDLGEVVCRAKVQDQIRPGVVSLPKGAWNKSSLNGRTSTALCPATTNIVGGGACYNDARVEVAPQR